MGYTILPIYLTYYGSDKNMTTVNVPEKESWWHELLESSAQFFSFGKVLNSKNHIKNQWLLEATSIPLSAEWWLTQQLGLF